MLSSQKGFSLLPPSGPIGPTRRRPMKPKCVVVVLIVGLAWLLPPLTQAGGKFKVLHNFGSGNDARDPSGPPLLDGKGNFYGVTGAGPGMDGNGVVYELTPQANGNWGEVILHAFTGGGGGAYPWGSLVPDGSGNMYGTMKGYLSYAVGGVFELSPGSGGWAYTVIYDSYSGPGLLTDGLGDLYGSMGLGEKKAGAGAELSPGSDGWVYTQLYSFCSQQNCVDGYDMPAPPIWDGKGNMFGTTAEGGNARSPCYNSSGCGVIFEMTPNDDGTWTYNVLHRFASSPTDGQRPFAGLVMDTAGNFYGSTAAGGRYGRRDGGYGNGTVFKFAFANGHWKETVLYDFPKHSDGTNPGYQMAFDKEGDLYGVAAAGGLVDCGGYECGVVFKLSPQKNGKWKYSVVHKFAGTDGGYPLGVIIDRKGNLFGTTQAFGKYYAGTAFEITP